MADLIGTWRVWWERARTRPRATAALAATVVVALLAGVFLAGRDGMKVGGAPHYDQSLVVQRGPFVATIAVAGTIVPGEDVEVTAPLEGVVRQVGFAYGDAVSQGQVLVAIDASDAVQRRNEAEADLLKARQTQSELASWASGPEVSRDRRAAASAAAELRETQRKVAQTKSLLDRGLVPRDEYEGIVQEQQSQEMALAAARQDLATTLRQGQGPNRRVAAIELQNANTRLAELDAQLAGAVVRAPAAGVIVHPPADKADAPGQIHVGLQLAKGQLIGSIARAGGLAVAFRLSETDADRVRPGQAVTVTGPGFAAFTLAGHVASVAGEAVPGSATSGPMAAFAASARLDDLSARAAQIVRIGMTANVVIQTYSNPAALVVPPAAISGPADAALVIVKNPATGRPTSRSVRLGQIAPDGVEILSGLKPGDTVLWASPKPAG